MFVPLFPNHDVLARSDHECSSGEIRIVQCIDEHGEHKYIYAYLFILHVLCLCTAFIMIALA